MTVLTPDIPQVESVIVEMTNGFRRENRLSDLKPNAQLTKAARAFAEFLAATNLFSHTADGRQPRDRGTAAGYAHCQIAENLALNLDGGGFTTAALARAAVEGWKNSPGHRRNLLAPHATEIGVGIAKAKGEEKYLSVQLLARPESLKYSFRINNAAAASVTYTFDGETHEIKPRYSVKHTACAPGTLTFERADKTASGQALRARYTATDGDVFVLRSSTSGVRIEHLPKDKAPR